MTASAEGLQQSGGVEMRVHGAGDHGVFSALGKPVYMGPIADRVRIGSLPNIPRHDLKLINWSRPSRRITRTLSWYLAYPFTLVNMAGYMGPERTDEPADTRLWRFMRTVIVVSSLMMTVAMALWMTVISETAWRVLDGAPRGLGSAFLCVFAPGVLAGVITIRMLRGRPLVDQGNRRVGLLNLVVLLATTGYLSARAVSGEALLDAGPGIARDPMAVMAAATTLVAWSFAIALCAIAWRTGRTALAGAGILIAFASAILHSAGSGLRLTVQTVLKYTPQAIERRVLGAHDSSRVLTQSAADTERVLPIDLIPLLFLMTTAVFGVLVWREYRRRKPADGGGVVEPRVFKVPAPSHLLLRDTPAFLGRVGVLGMLVSLGLWITVSGVLVAAQHRGSSIDDLLTFMFVGLKIAGLLLLVALVARRPEHVVARVKRVVESVADVAGFWAPDLHPLAGASYRLAVLRGLRRGVREVRRDGPGKPIALVGHSQGAVICAWFVRGGYWEERSSEDFSDEDALTMRMHHAAHQQSDRIGLFTCGSPIGSLYRIFFPRYFNESFYATAARMSDRNVWHNYWRTTDPIGARLTSEQRRPGVGEPHVRDVDVTEFADEVTKGHCEYWQDGRVRRDIEEFFSSCELVDRPAQGVPAAFGMPRGLRGLKAVLPRLHLHRN